MTAFIVAGCGLMRPPKSPGECMLDAARDGDVQELKEILGRNRSLVIARDDRGRSALHLAAAAGHDEIVKLLLDNGADHTRTDRDGATPLYAAAKSGHTDVVRMLLVRGADVYVGDQSSPRDIDPIADAASDEIASLLRHKAVVVAVNSDGTYSVEGEQMALESIGGLIRERAMAWPLGEDDLPTIEVRILAHSDCEYKWIQEVMVKCMRAYVWKISFGAAKSDESRWKSGEQQGPPAR